MSRTAWFVLLLAVSSGAAAMPRAHDPNRAACEVWQREMAFAQSVQRHDAAGFATFLADNTVFNASTDKPTRGAYAVSQHWAAMIAGKTVHLDWYPQHVVATADGALAYSSGVYLFENSVANAKPRYVSGHFYTTWRHDGDDVWRVAFDGGDEGKPASDAEVKAFRAGRQNECPMVAVAELPTIRH
ncbi:MAG: YybH family protein [Lysobacterales bacterium]|jgi:ketosteroid isomerase-like protein